MDESKAFLVEYENSLKDIVAREGLFTLIDFDKKKFDGENALAFNGLITKTRDHLNSDGRFDMLFSDLIDSISSDVKFALANAYLYFPDANNFMREIMRYPDGTQLPTYFRKLADKRFFFYVNVTFEKLYNFWDRIGDILALAFQLDLSEQAVAFSSAIKKIDENPPTSSEPWSWLRNFHYEDYQKILNRLRIKIVHYRQKDTYFHFEWLGNVMRYSTNPEGIRALQKEKDELLPLLKRQLELANTGYKTMIHLIKESGPFEQ